MKTFKSVAFKSVTFKNVLCKTSAPLTVTTRALRMT